MLIWEMACENPTLGEERIANELKVKLGIQVSPRTVGKREAAKWRAARWYDSPGVPGLSHSGERAAIAPDSERITIEQALILFKALELPSPFCRVSSPQF